MKLFNYKNKISILIFLVLQVILFNTCYQSSNVKNQNSKKVGFLGLYLNQDSDRFQSVWDSLLSNGDIRRIEPDPSKTNSIWSDDDKIKYCYHFYEISKFLNAEIKVTASSLVEFRNSEITLTFCHISNIGGKRASPLCTQDEIEELFELYKQKYGNPTLLSPQNTPTELPRMTWGDTRLSPQRVRENIIYFWEISDYIIYFDFGLKEVNPDPNEIIFFDNLAVLYNWVRNPIINYTFSKEYIDKLSKEKQMKKKLDLKGKI